MKLRFEKTAGVYFILCKDGTSSPPIKIGYSDDIEFRRAALQGGCPYPLEIVAYTTGTQRTEKDLHAFFALQRIHGEWFRLDRELRDFIERIREHFESGARA